MEDCERALVGHWSQLGRLPGGTLHAADGLVWFETPVRHLPYNGVVHTQLPGVAQAEAAIERMLAHFEARDAQFFWVVHPSATPPELGGRLAAAGLQPVETMHFMALELDGWAPPAPAPDVTLELAQTEESIRTYSELTFAYWEIPPEEQDGVAALHRAVMAARLPGQPYLAWIDGRPVGKAYLSFTGAPGTAGIYGMSVLPEARGRGVAAALTGAMMARAKEAGCRRAVLHATDMAVGVYRRTGFADCGSADVFATAPLWTEH